MSQLVFILMKQKHLIMYRSLVQPKLKNKLPGLLSALLPRGKKRSLAEPCALKTTLPLSRVGALFGFE